MNIEEATPQHGEVMMKKHERDAAIAKLEAEKALLNAAIAKEESKT